MKKQNIIMGISFILLIFMVIGVSYAAYKFSAAGTKENVISTGTISMSYSQNSFIDLKHTYPKTDTYAIATKEDKSSMEFSVSMETSGTKQINYALAITNIEEGTTLKSDKVKIYLEKAYQNPNDLTAREKMAEASIVAGVAFSHPRTTGSHACSFPLTNIYGVPHGEACAFTLDYFLKFNATHADDDGRITALAKDCGFENAYEMADEITAMKKRMKMRCTLSEIGCTTDEQIDELAKKSMSMLMTRNPITLTEKDIKEMYIALK